jgi:hypothetical protein
MKEEISKVLEKVGIALFHAQIMEKELAYLLLIPKMKRDGELAPDKDIRDLSEKLDRKTFGSLIKELKKEFHIESSLEDGIESALLKRNYLAHNFFAAHQGKLDDSGELKLMTNELSEMSDQFSMLFKTLREEATSLLRQIGFLKRDETIEDLLKQCS